MPKLTKTAFCLVRTDPNYRKASLLIINKNTSYCIERLEIILKSFSRKKTRNQQKWVQKSQTKLIKFLIIV